MDVSIVIPTWRGRHLLESYLPSVLAAAREYQNQTGKQAEVVIVEDGSDDDTAAWVRSCYPSQVLLFEHATNRGFAAACWTGVEKSRYPLVLLLNNDVRLEPDCIAPLGAHFADPRVFAVSGKIFNQKGDVFCNGGKIARFRRGMWSTYENYDVLPGRQQDGPLFSFTAVAAFCAFDRAKFLQLGGFDPLVFLVEDIELSYRAWKRGWLVKYEPGSVAYHDASQTIATHYRKRHVDGLSRRNRILMHWMLLHDRWMFLRHLTFLLARFSISWLALDWRFYWGIFSGLRNLSHILHKRQATRRTMARSDRELLELLSDFYRTAPIEPRKA